MGIEGCAKWQSRCNGIIWTQSALNPKHEIRNSKQSQMTKFQMLQIGKFKHFEFRKFEFVSDFDIRIFELQTVFGSNHSRFVIRREGVTR
jgi:hypothetical protein